MLAVTDVKGVTMVLPASVPPLTPGVNAGYWFELRSATQSLYTRGLMDPTTTEIVSVSPTRTGARNASVWPT